MPPYWWVYLVILMVCWAVMMSLRPRPTLCLCGHNPDMHEHYRAGSDCGKCGKVNCPRFRAAR